MKSLIQGMVDFRMPDLLTECNPMDIEDILVF